jgi:hypothetical protein
MLSKCVLIAIPYLSLILYLVKVKEPPKEGRANQAVVKLLAAHFAVSQTQVKILSGFRSRNKVIEVGKDQCG